MKKKLVITQKVNKNDSNLGFFHEWLSRLADKVDGVFVVCLEKGEHTLPNNVVVLSLGKEVNKNIRYPIFNIFYKLKYLFKFYYFIIKYRHEYDGVFVHMNPEYCILGGALWRLWHKKILLWYTHKTVNWRLRLGALFTNKIFTASKESFRLKSKKVEIVGHGIPVELFAVQANKLPNAPFNLLAVGRKSLSKDFETAQKAVDIIKNKFPFVKFEIISDKTYSELPVVYANAHILIHTSRTGSMDKVVLEALAVGRIVITSSEAYTGFEQQGIVYIFPVGNFQELANIIEKIYHSGILNQLPIKKNMDYVQNNYNLDNVIIKIVNYFI